MRKYLFLASMAVMLTACMEDIVVEHAGPKPLEDAPETLIVGFEGDDTRIELNEEVKTVWTEGDLVSVYFYSDANQKWQHQGSTGERVGTLKRVDAGPATAKIDYVVVAYPYSKEYTLNRTNSKLIASLPALQSYKKDSYGIDGNIMVARSEFTQFTLKSVVGWLRVALTGEGRRVDNIVVRGNGGEQLAGMVYVDTATAEATFASEMGATSDEEQVGGVGGNLLFDDALATEVTLQCGKGVRLGAEPTEFYIALLPQTFEQGITVEILCDGYRPMEVTTDKSITIERNHIQPMAAVEYVTERVVPENELWYTATELVTPFDVEVFDAAILTNEWNELTGVGVITFDGVLTTIGDGAFFGCDGLTAIKMSDSVTTIDSMAFMRCGDLTKVVIGNGVTSIGYGAFSDCPKLTEFKGKFAVDNGRSLIVDNTIVAYASASGIAYTIPDTVTDIEDWTFGYCSELVSITIPNSVTRIGSCAFYYCGRLLNVNIPDSVKIIGESAFIDCGLLKSVTLGSGVETIEEFAFCDCKRLESVTIQEGVKTIDKYCFSGCGALKSIDIPDSVVSIGDALLGDCYALESVTIGSGVKSIGNVAFTNCSTLTSVTIPESVEIIGTQAFYNCGSLESVYCKATSHPILSGQGVFDGNASGRKIYVPADSVEEYQNAVNWSPYSVDIVAYDFVNDTVVAQ